MRWCGTIGMQILTLGRGRWVLGGCSRSSCQCVSAGQAEQAPCINCDRRSEGLHCHTLLGVTWRHHRLGGWAAAWHPSAVLHNPAALCLSCCSCAVRPRSCWTTWRVSCPTSQWRLWAATRQWRSSHRYVGGWVGACVTRAGSGGTSRQRLISGLVVQRSDCKV